MSKNKTTGQLDVKSRDQLYDEIVNGFNEHGSVSKKAKFSNVQIQRIKKVGELWGNNVDTHVFYSNILDLISPITSLKAQFQMMDISDDEEKDEDENEEDEIEKTPGSIFRVLSIFNNFWDWWVRYKRLKRKIIFTKELIDSYRQTTMAQKIITIQKIEAKLDATLFDMFETMLDPVIQGTSEGAIKLYESDKVQRIFTKIKEKQDQIKRHATIQTATFALSNIPGPFGAAMSAVGTLENIYHQAVEVGSLRKTIIAVGTGFADVGLSMSGGKIAKTTYKIVKVANATAKAGDIAYSLAGIDFSSVRAMMKNIVSYTKEDEDETRTRIREDLTEPTLIPLATQLNRRIMGIRREMEDSLATREAYLLQAAKQSAGNQMKISSLLGKVNDLREERDRERENAAAEGADFDIRYETVSLGSSPTFQNYNVSWKGGYLRNAMRSSFTRRINVNVEGEIPDIQTTEVLTLRILTGSLVQIQKGIFNVAEKIRKIIFDTNNYKDFEKTITAIDRTIRNKDGWEKRISNYGLVGDEYKMTKENEDNAYDWATKITDTFSGFDYIMAGNNSQYVIYRSWEHKFNNELMMIFNNTNYDNLVRNNEQIRLQIDGIIKKFNQQKERNTAISNRGYKWLVDDNRDQQKVIPTFEKNGAIKSIIIDYVIYKYSDDMPNSPIDYISCKKDYGTIMIYPEFAKRLIDNHVLIYSYGKGTYDCYFEIVNAIQGGLETPSIVTNDKKELELETKINDTAKLIKDAFLKY